MLLLLLLKRCSEMLDLSGALTHGGLSFLMFRALRVQVAFALFRNGLLMPCGRLRLLLHFFGALLLSLLCSVRRRAPRFGIVHRFGKRSGSYIILDFELGLGLAQLGFRNSGPLRQSLVGFRCCLIAAIAPGFGLVDRLCQTNRGNVILRFELSLRRLQLCLGVGGFREEVLVGLRHLLTACAATRLSLAHRLGQCNGSPVILFSQLDLGFTQLGLRLRGRRQQRLLRHVSLTALRATFEHEVSVRGALVLGGPAFAIDFRVRVGDGLVRAISPAARQRQQHCREEAAP
mmetsp:Transcript_72064/g.208669  ORF Transcript_72064/g.208669 Transcript_72064/m.208669 type:complete len:289 (+) Transcript_72064:795-1661(+)